MPSVLQVLISLAKDYSLSDSCPALVEKILQRQQHIDPGQTTWLIQFIAFCTGIEQTVLLDYPAADSPSL